MYASDYGFGAVPKAWTTTLMNYGGSVNGSTIRSQNWMHMGYYDWTILRRSDVSSVAFGVNCYGVLFTRYDVRSYYGVRPSFNLESTVAYVSGSGSMSDPIRVN